VAPIADIVRTTSTGVYERGDDVVDIGSRDADGSTTHTRDALVDHRTGCLSVVRQLQLHRDLKPAIEYLIGTTHNEACRKTAIPTIRRLGYVPLSHDGRPPCR